MTAWWEQDFVNLDTEATARDPEEALLASICLAEVNPAARSMEVRSALVAVEMPDEASEVNGLTTEQLMADGKPAADVLDEFCAAIAGHLAAGTPVVVANAPYDLVLLDRDARRNGVPTITDRLDGRPLAPIVDPGVLDKRVVKFRKRVSETQGARCLKTLCQVHGVAWDDDLAHTAEYDALQAGRVVWQLMRKYPRLAAMSLADLHDAQKVWFREQAEGLASFWLRTANQKEFDAAEAEDDAVRATALEDAALLRSRACEVSPWWPMRPWAVAV